MVSQLSTAAATPDELAELVVNLFEQYASPLCAYLYRLVGDWELASDLAQETFLRLYQERHKLHNVENQRAWLYRIATHVATDALRHRQRFRWLPWLKLEREPRLVWRDLNETVSQRDAVVQALAALPTHYRLPLLLYSYYGFSVQETAMILQIREGTVKTRLHRAREKFRQVYERANEART